MPPSPTFITTTRATAVPMLASESLIFKTRRSVLFLILPIIFVSVVGVVLAIVFNQISLSDQIVLFMRLGIIVAIVFVDLVIVLDWLTTQYTLTSRRVQFSFGIIGQQVKTISLEQVTSADTQFGILARIFGYGTILIVAANINSQISFKGISDPKTKLDLINAAVIAAQSDN